MKELKELLKNKYATVIWIARTFSRFGDAFESLALMYIVYDLTDSALAMGTIMILGVLPNIIVSPFAGVLGDRYNKKIIMSIAEIVRTSMVLIVPLLHMNGMLKLWHLYLIEVVVSIAESFFEPCAQAVMVMIVKKEQLPVYNSAVTTTNQVARLLGYSLSGVVISLVNTDIIFVIDAMTFAFSAIASLCIKLPVINSDNKNEKRGVFKDMHKALKYVLATGLLPVILLAIIINGFILTPETEFLPIVIEDLLKTNISWSGIFLTITSVGNLLSSITFPMLSKTKLKLRHLILFGQGIMGVAFILIFIKPNIITGLLLYVTLGYIASLITIWCSTEMQYICEIKYMARVSSIFTIALIVSDPLSAAVYGVLVDTISIGNVFLINGILFIIFAVFIYSIMSKISKSSKYSRICKKTLENAAD